MYEKFKDRPFTILAVNAWNEEPEAIRHFAGENKLAYPMLLKGQAAADAWGVSGVPDNFLVDRSGDVVHKHVTINEKTMAKIEAKIRKLLD